MYSPIYTYYQKAPRLSKLHRPVSLLLWSELDRWVLSWEKYSEPSRQNNFWWEIMGFEQVDTNTVLHTNVITTKCNHFYCRICSSGVMNDTLKRELKVVCTLSVSWWHSVHSIQIAMKAACPEQSDTKTPNTKLHKTLQLTLNISSRPIFLQCYQNNPSVQLLIWTQILAF